MDRFDRIFDLHKLLSAARRPIPRERIERELECSRATAKRIIEAMRLYLNAPIRYSREYNGYYYDPGGESMYQLPGVWFNASELHALLSVQQLLSDIQPGLLERQLAPLRGRIEQLLKAQHAGGDIGARIRILQAAARPPGRHFQTVADALARRRRLALGYHNRASDERTEREVSPQRLIHYRDNWYLDAWCHLRRGLRTFALEAIDHARDTGREAREIDTQTLDTHYRSAYGIFAGRPEQQAVLRFSAVRARWVSAEQWHPEQHGQWLADGSYQLTLPYSRPHELTMDILRYGPDVEVIAPAPLRRQIAQRLRQAAALYA